MAELDDQNEIKGHLPQLKRTTKMRNEVVHHGKYLPDGWQPCLDIKQQREIATEVAMLVGAKCELDINPAKL